MASDDARDAAALYAREDPAGESSEFLPRATAWRPRAMAGTALRGLAAFGAVLLVASAMVVSKSARGGYEPPVVTAVPGCKACLGAGNATPPGMRTALLATSALEHPETGENSIWYGPFTLPEPGVVTSFLPVANLSFVHHMVVYKSATLSGAAPGFKSWSQLPGPMLSRRDQIVFAWARTGQTTPLQFDTAEGTGVFVGPGTDAQEIYLNVHFEVPAAVAADTRSKVGCGLRITMDNVSSTELAAWADCAKSGRVSGECPERQGLGVEILEEHNFKLGPKQPIVTVLHTCRVTRDTRIYAYRNHAHGAGRQFLTHLFRDGVDTGAIVNRSVQDPQIFYTLPDGGQELRTGDVLQLHCNYETMDRDYLTRVGADLSLGEEMCNQYLMFYPLVPHGPPGLCRKTPKPARLEYALRPILRPGDGAAEGLPGPESLGETSATAVSPDGATVFVLARRMNSFDTASLIMEPTIFVLDAASGAVLRQLGAGLFVTPHGLHCDADGALWATDTSLHLVFKLSSSTGEVLLRLGEARVPGFDPYHFNKPTDVAVDPTRGLAFVSDGYGNSRVAVFNATTGAYVRTWGGTRGSAPGEFDIPHSIAVDPRRDSVFVADRQNCRLQVFSSTGELKSVWPSELCATQRSREQPWLTHWSAVAYSAYLDVLFSVEGEFLTMRRPDSGVVVRTWGSPGNLVWPHDIDVAANKAKPEVYVAELDGKSVRRLVLRPTRL